jgi:Cu/Ag efflux pump CusA
MRFNISAVAIRNPIPPIVLFILLTIAGLIAFLQLDITDNPDIDVPIVSVVVSRPGSAPTELEPRSPARSRIRSPGWAASTISNPRSPTEPR